MDLLKKLVLTSLVLGFVLQLLLHQSLLHKQLPLQHQLFVPRPQQLLILLTRGLQLVHQSLHLDILLLQFVNLSVLESYTFYNYLVRGYVFDVAACYGGCYGWNGAFLGHFLGLDYSNSFNLIYQLHKTHTRMHLNTKNYNLYNKKHL